MGIDQSGQNRCPAQIKRLGRTVSQADQITMVANRGNAARLDQNGSAVELSSSKE
jgi:hypothetical protein